MADLLTLSELKTLLGISPTDPRRDDMLEAMIPAISRLITSFTGRDFGAPLVTEEREFQYDGDGLLDIDDCIDITRVAVRVLYADDYPLQPEMWFAQPPRRDDSPVYYYLELGTGYATFGSPEMGFTRNQDVYAAEGRYPRVPTIVKVTATWGWPDIPADVKQAAVWTAQEWMSRASGEGLTSEAIASYSRSWGAKNGAGASLALAIPSRALDVLSNYEKHQV